MAAWRETRTKAAPPVTRRTYVCARCGRVAPADKMIRSAHTGNRYCAEKHLTRPRKIA